MKRLLFNALVMTMLMQLPLALACQSKQKVETKEEKAFKEKAIKMAKSGDVRIDFWGRVVDQSEQPVPGAEVEMSVDCFSPLLPPYFIERKPILMKTDGQGYFRVRNELGNKLFIGKIKRSGFEYVYWQNPGIESLFYYSDYVPVFVPDPNHPVVYHLRKIGEASFLRKGELKYGQKVADSGLEKGFDLIRDANISAERLPNPYMNGEPLCCDLRIKATWNGKQRAWTAVLSIDTPAGGLLLSDQLLYEAPKDGYQPSLTLAPTPGAPTLQEKLGPRAQEQPRPRYLYVRSRTPFIYARIELSDNFDVNDKPFIYKKPGPDDDFYLGIRGHYVVNPYGDRNLEMAKDLPGDLRQKLDEQVRDTYRFNVNGRPLKPDLQKLIKESGSKKW